MAAASELLPGDGRGRSLTVCERVSSHQVRVLSVERNNPFLWSSTKRVVLGWAEWRATAALRAVCMGDKGVLHLWRGAWSQASPVTPLKGFM